MIYLRNEGSANDLGSISLEAQLQAKQIQCESLKSTLETVKEVLRPFTAAAAHQLATINHNDCVRAAELLKELER